ncbi:MAG: protein kinase, partial [Oscillospiraceae bacterium]
MEEITMLNASLYDDGRTALNSRLFDTNETVLNAAVSSGRVYSAGAVIASKYSIVSKMEVVTGEADLYICTFEEKSYVAKLYRRAVAVKDEVVGLLKSIDSPYVAKIFDTGVWDGRVFEILPLYKNGSLQGRRFSFDELKSNIIPSLNEGLHVLHQAGIIHKDLKPSNIMLSDNGRDVAIIDFGISSVKSENSTVIVTKTGMTPEYSAPETFRSLYLEESDYYSLGITVYE